MPTPFKFVVAGKYGFLTQDVLDDSDNPPSRDVRDAKEFDSFDAAVAFRFYVTDGKVLMVCLG